jgi:hypothetical protein
MPAFRRSVLALLGILVLDVVVAWGLYGFLVPVNRGLSLLTAWLRLVYAGILGVALVQLIELLALLGEGLPSSDALATGAGAAALARLDAYYAIWGAGLIVFGLHLAGLGLLVLRSGHVLWSDFSVPLSSAGWAELVFMLWLLWAGLRRTQSTGSGRCE